MGDSIYAAGDVIGPPGLASTEVEQGKAEYDQCLRGRVFAPKGLLKLVFDKNDGTIVGVHIIGNDACELIHFGMECVDKGTTIFEVMKMVFTAVTFHELFKAAAVDGNSKLQFGIEWQGVLKELGQQLLGAVEANRDEDPMEEPMEEKDVLAVVREQFNAMDLDGSGSLDAEELKECFEAIGAEISIGTLKNMIRLADEDGDGDISFDEFLPIAKATFNSQKGSNTKLLSQSLDKITKLVNAGSTSSTAGGALSNISVP